MHRSESDLSDSKISSLVSDGLITCSAIPLGDRLSDLLRYRYGVSMFFSRRRRLSGHRERHEQSALSSSESDSSGPPSPEMMLPLAVMTSPSSRTASWAAHWASASSRRSSTVFMVRNRRTRRFMPAETTDRPNRMNTRLKATYSGLLWRALSFWRAT